MDWDVAYTNVDFIQDGASYPDRWARDAAAYRAELGDRLEPDVAYGPEPRQAMDIFHPDAPSRGLALFVHGGYWMKFDRKTWSHLAEGARGSGWTVVLPSYRLAPDVTLPDIVSDVTRAIEAAAARVPGPIRLAGHSAGGHLATRMVCGDTSLTPETSARIEGILSISGVHDLRPLLGTAMRETLHLDASVAERESPALKTPRSGTRAVIWVGSDERPEFIRLSRLIANSWSLPDCTIRLVEAPGRHHFDVVEPLTDPASELTAAFLEG